MDLLRCCFTQPVEQRGKEAHPSEKRAGGGDGTHKQAEENNIFLFYFCLVCWRFHTLYELMVLIREQRVSAGAKVQLITESDSKEAT